MTKVCVTGNNGFIGSALTKELEKKRFEVIGLEKWIYERERWQDRLVEYLHDKQPEAVFHVGACSNTQNTDVSEMMKLNAVSTSIIAEWCELKKIPLIYSSSASIYGNNNSPETLYAWSKYLGEQFATKSGAVALRYFNVYGMNEMHKGNMASIICQSFLKDRKGEKIELFPTQPMRDFVYINDVVSANLYALNNYNMARGGWFDVGSGQVSTFEEIMNLMNLKYEYTPESKIPKFYQKYTKADVRNFMKGWNPEYSLERGMNEYLDLLKVSVPLI
jgi:ADP-L-glycero-D-manno-heptose 6-epimerase